jgi:hypothetical protein
MLAVAAFSFISIAGRPLGGPSPAEQAGQHDATTQATAPGDHTMPGGHMMMNGQMMADMKAADAKLDQLVADMNGAKGDAKVAAIARVVTELVNHQKTMHAHMSAMQAGMHEKMMSSKK